MRIAAFALAALLPLQALAGPMEDQYFQARDKAVKEVEAAQNAKKPQKQIDKIDQTARAQLEKQMRAIIGAVSFKGYDKGKLARDSLYGDDIGSDTLDGLFFATEDGDSTITVSNEALLKQWLKSTTSDDPAITELFKKPVEEIFASENFYTYAASPDAAFSKTAVLNVTKPDGATVLVAMAGVYRQDIGPYLPDTIQIGMIRNGIVYLASKTAKTQFEKIPACETIWSESEAKAKEKMDAYQAGGAKDEALADESFAIQDKGDAAYTACLAEALPKAPGFDGLTKEAQDFVASIAAGGK